MLKTRLSQIIAAVVLILVAFFIGRNMSGGVGGTTNYDALELSGALTVTGATSFSGGTTIGTNGTAITAIKAGACTIWSPATTIAATTTQQIVCQGATNGGITAITGITTDSICSLIMASSTNTTVGGLVVGGASASSTAGNIVARLANFTGTTFTWTAAASSSAQWNYSCIDPS